MTQLVNDGPSRRSSTAQGMGKKPKSSRGHRGAIIWGTRSTVVVLLIVVWEVMVRVGWLNPLFTSSPSQIWKSLMAGGWRTITTQLPTTLLEMIYGLVLGFAVGFIVGVLFSRVPILNDTFRPLYVAANSLPRIALAPLFIIWFGLGIDSKVALAFTLVVFIVLLNTIAGLDNVDRDLLQLARSMGVGRWRLLREFLLPSAIPMLAAALELSIVYSFLGVITGELVGGSKGLGVQMTEEATAFQTSDFFATLFVLAVVTTILTQAMHYGVRRMLRWHAIEMRGLS